MSDKKHYIPNEFGRTWVTSRFEARRGVHLPLSYIDINDGNVYDAIVFSQIMYWHEPNTETGKPRLRRWLNGYLWLVKNHADWYAECRINRATVRKCLERIRDRKLIHYELHGERGEVAPFIRVNWDMFEKVMRVWINQHATEDTPDTSGQGVCPDVSDPLLPEVKSNTETTPKTTQRKNSVAPKSGATDSDSATHKRIAGSPYTTDDVQRWKQEGAALDANKPSAPVSIDDFTTRADSLTNADTRRQPFEALKDAVTAVWGWDNQGVVTNVAKMLAGKRGKGEYETYRFDTPMTADELELWAVWYRRTYPKLSLAQRPDAIAKSVGEYRAAQANPQAAPMVTPDDVQDMPSVPAADLLNRLRGR